MIKEAIDRILSLAAPNISRDEEFGLERSDKPLILIQPPMPTFVKVQTLMGVSNLISEKLEGIDKSKVMLHVESQLEVSLIDITSDKWGRRRKLIQASCAEDVGKFEFGKFLKSEFFVIGLQACFQQSDDRDYLMKICTNLSAEASTISSDDGISQKVTVNQGVVLKATEVVKPRVTLAPFRTFREVEQPDSEFIFRVRCADGEPPVCALFEADGGKWRLDAIANVARWLSANVSDVAVIS